MQTSSVTGTVVRKYSSDKGKTPFTQVTLKYLKRSYVAGGEVRMDDRYLNVLAFGRDATALAEATEGDQVWASGEAQTSQPYEKDGKWRSGLEIVARDFIILSGGGAKSAPAEKAPAAEEDNDEDGYTDPFVSH